MIRRRARRNRKRTAQGTAYGGKKRRLAWALTVLVILAASGAGFWYGRQVTGPDLLGWADQFFEIQVTDVTGALRVSREEILALLDLEPERGLLSVDPEALEQVLKTHPWIRHAEVRRVFPKTLVVKIKEREPVAFLRTEGRVFMLDREGAIISGQSGEPDGLLPVLTGANYVDAVLGTPTALQRVRAGIALAGLLDRTGARLTEVDLRTPGDIVAYYSGLRLRFGEGALEEKVDRYRRVSDRLIDRWGGQTGAGPGPGVEVDLRFRDRIIVRERG